MFMDEARFGRISDTRRCWCPKPSRPVCYAMVSQEYTYAYAAVSISDGNMDSLILPHVNGECMQVFLDEVAVRHLNDQIMDPANKEIIPTRKKAEPRSRRKPDEDQFRLQEHPGVFTAPPTSSIKSERIQA